MNGGCGCGRRGAGVPGCRGVGAVAGAGTGGCGCGCECGFGFGSSGAAGGCGCGCRPSCAGAFDDLVSGTGDRTVAAGYAEALAGLYARSGVRLASRQTPIRSWRLFIVERLESKAFETLSFNRLSRQLRRMSTSRTCEVRGPTFLAAPLARGLYNNGPLQTFF